MTLSPFAIHRNYRLSRTHVADIREPLVEALYHHRLAQELASDVGGFPSDPDARDEWEELTREVTFNVKRCNDILADLHKNRKLERGSINPSQVAA